MNYVHLPTLQRTTLIRITIVLWMQADIKSIWLQLQGGISTEKWRKLEEIVQERIDQFHLPRTLKKEGRTIIRPIGNQIRDMLLQESYRQWVSSLGTREWTSKGTIDFSKLAEKLVGNEHVNLEYRFTVACIYCLEMSVYILWNRLTEGQQTLISKYAVDNEELVVFWICLAQDNFQRLHQLMTEHDPGIEDCNEYALQISMDKRYVFAMSYFLHKLPEQKRNTYLMDVATKVVFFHYDFWIPQDTGTAMLCSLLTQMNEENQTDFLKVWYYHTLRRLLDWPYYEFVVPTANHVWSHMKIVNFVKLIVTIIGRLSEDYTVYHVILRDFYRQSPIHFQQYIKEHEKRFLPTLMNVGAI